VRPESHLENDEADGHFAFELVLGADDCALGNIGMGAQHLHAVNNEANDVNLLS
jgi:hypothetical protein